MSIKDVVYKGAGNRIRLVLTEDDSAISLEAITRMLLTVGGTTFDSDTAVNVFDWQTDSSVLELNLGGQNLPVGLHRCRLKVFSPDYPYPKGLVWADNVMMQVIV